MGSIPAVHVDTQLVFSAHICYFVHILYTSISTCTVQECKIYLPTYSTLPMECSVGTYLQCLWYPCNWTVVLFGRLFSFAPPITRLACCPAALSVGTLTLLYTILRLGSICLYANSSPAFYRHSTASPPNHLPQFFHLG